MSYIDQKLEEAEKQREGDSVARARLGGHLAFRGFIVTEKDALGPVEVMLHSGGSMEWWRRDCKVKSDWQMKLVRREPLRYEWP